MNLPLIGDKIYQGTSTIDICTPENPSCRHQNSHVSDTCMRGLFVVVFLMENY